MSGHNIGLLIRSSAEALSFRTNGRSRVEAAQARRAVRSRVIAGLTIAVLGAVIAVGAVILTSANERWNSSLTLASIGAVFLLLGLGGGPLLRGIAVARMQRSRPAALVFLALREPTVAPHLQTYQYRKDNTANIPDAWVMAVVDARGISVWSGRIRSRELILIEWSEIGEVTAVSFTSLTGRNRIGAAIDVRPIRSPLLVSLGYAAWGVEGSVDHEGVLAIVDSINSRRSVQRL